MSAYVRKCPKMSANVTRFWKNGVLQYNRKDDRKDKFHFKFSFQERASLETAVPFTLGKEAAMAEEKIIYCPQCGRRVMKYDGKGTIPLDAGCKKCRKRVVYFPETDEVKVTKIPPRCSSGTRLWF